MELKTSLEVSIKLMAKIEEAEQELKITQCLKTKNKYKFIEYYKGLIHGLKTARNLVIDNSKLGALKKENITIQIITQHQAIANKHFAKRMNNNGISYHDETIYIDASKGTPELEFINKKNGKNNR